MIFILIGLLYRFFSADSIALAVGALFERRMALSRITGIMVVISGLTWMPFLN